MSESVQTNPVVDAPETEAGSPLGLGGPVPQPIAPADPIAAIPDDADPVAVARQLLESACPDAPSILAARIAAIGREIDDFIELYRTTPRLPFADFAAHVIGRARLRRALQVRAGQSPSPEPVAVTVLGVIKQVKRFRPAGELRKRRAELVAETRRALAEVEGRIRGTVQAARDGHGFATSDLKASGAGFDHIHDEIGRRLEAALTTRRVLAEKLAALDGDGDVARSLLARQDVAAAGGVDALVEALAPRQTVPAESDLAKLLGDIEALADKVLGIDDESKLHAELTDRLEGLKARLPVLQSTVKQQRQTAAAALVSAAVDGGSLPAVAALEQAVGPINPKLAAALGSIVADDDALLAVLGEMAGKPVGG
jgi:hypothetical protein